MSEELEYHSGQPMRWRPSRVQCISAGYPLQEQEPMDLVGKPTELSQLLAERYGCIVQLEPGDGTRYSVVLMPLAAGFTLSTTGLGLDAPYVTMWAGQADRPVPCGMNQWTSTFLSWWAEILRARDDSRARRADEAYLLWRVKKRAAGGDPIG